MRSETVASDVASGVETGSVGEAHETCPSCGGRGRVIGTSLGAQVFSCGSCDLWFLASSVRVNAARDNGWYEGMVDCDPRMLQRFVGDTRPAFRRQLSHLARYTRGRALLDVGCGIGLFLATARAAGWDVHGVDESPHARVFAEQRLGLSYATDLAAFAPRTLDVIRLSHVLEHVPEPRGFLRVLHSLLSESGVLFVIVPQREPLCATLVNQWRRRRSDLPALATAIYPDMHVLGFTTTSLTSVLAEAGFRAEDVRTVSMGNPTYFPMFYDGLLTRKRLRELEFAPRYWLPQIVDNIGNRWGKGQWVVGYFRRA